MKWGKNPFVTLHWAYIYDYRMRELSRNIILPTENQEGIDSSSLNKAMDKAGKSIGQLVALCKFKIIKWCKIICYKVIDLLFGMYRQLVKSMMNKENWFWHDIHRLVRSSPKLVIICTCIGRNSSTMSQNIGFSSDFDHLRLKI